MLVTNTTSASTLMKTQTTQVRFFTAVQQLFVYAPTMQLDKIRGCRHLVGGATSSPIVKVRTTRKQWTFDGARLPISTKKTT
jgi:hypothetical protein